MSDHFDERGYMQTGWFTDADGHKYYLHDVGDWEAQYSRRRLACVHMHIQEEKGSVRDSIDKEENL